ncbi:MAG TPA: hypothetical protein VM943_06085 [Pyrinomonadaceae bacterium]|nr:hypothetical protein [Pyrinomonadaceae bacterium]
MFQFRALVWLKWRLFRNALRSRKAAVNRAASALGTLASLVVALLFATGLGFATYFLTSPENFDAPTGFARVELAGFLFLLSVFAFVYLLWAIVPLGVGGGGSQFDPARLLLYPISFRKLFTVDVLSELTSLGTIFAVPIVLAVSFAAGLAGGQIAKGLLAGVGALVFGLAFAKLLSTSIGALMRKRRSRGETVLALLGAVAGLAGAFLGQLAPYLARHAETFRGMRWTPPGAVAIALTKGLRDGGGGEYTAALLTLTAYTVVFVLITYRVMRRAALGAGGAKRAAGVSPQNEKSREAEAYVGWRLPLMSAQLSAIVEKELRYAVRNAPLRMLALMPLILIGIRFMQRGDGESERGSGLARVTGTVGAAFLEYGEGAIPAAGVLYVFLILSSISCNLFAFEEGGMRAFILSPLPRRTILVGKNIVTVCLALLFALLLVAINQLVFRDLTALAALFAAICFVVFAALSALFGNWLSIHFPKRMQFGKRLNASGVTGLLIIPIAVVMMLPPLVSVVAGYVTQSLPVKYGTLALCAAVAVALYALLVGTQGRALARREHEILDAVSGRSDN